MGREAEDVPREIEKGVGMFRALHTAKHAHIACMFACLHDEASEILTFNTNLPVVMKSAFFLACLVCLATTSVEALYSQFLGCANATLVSASAIQVTDRSACQVREALGLATSSRY